VGDDLKRDEKRIHCCCDGVKSSGEEDGNMKNDLGAERRRLL